MKGIYLLLLLPLLVYAQEFPYQQEIDTIPVTINGWQPFCPWNFGMYTTTPGLGDLDGDMDLDLLVGEWNGHLDYFENQGTPESAAYSFMTTNFDSLVASANFEYYNDPRLCDLDADGDLDLMWGNGGRIFVYRNQGSAQQRDFVLEDSLFSYSQDVQNCDLVDIDDDGDLDIFCGGYQGRILFARNDGNAQQYSFTVISEQFNGIDVGYWSHTNLCDIDADGDYDLFVGCGTGKIYYYLNDGDSVNYHFTLMTNYFAGIDVGDMSAPEFCDIDGDEDYDLFVGREPNLSNATRGDVYFYENVGDSANPQFQYITSNYLTIDAGYTARQQLVDINGDQKFDLMVSDGKHLVYYRNTGSAQSPSFVLEDSAFGGISLVDLAPWFCDIDGDGDYDLVAGTSAIPGPPGLHLYLNQGTAQNPNLVLYSSDFVPGDYFVCIAPALADINADGLLELFITDQGSQDIWYFENTGSPIWPHFQLVTQNWQGISLFVEVQRYLSFYDIDGDGDLDLFFNNNWLEGSENLRFYRNTGNPQNPNMSMETQDFLPFEVIVPSPTFCDIDSDGRTDLFVGDSNGGVLFFHGVDSTGFSLPPVQRHPLAGTHLSIGPNPANPVTFITFSLPYPQEATLAVYNLLGAKVTTLTSGLQPSGEQSFLWDASRKASGVYIVRLEAVGEMRAGKILLVK